MRGRRNSLNHINRIFRNEWCKRRPPAQLWLRCLLRKVEHQRWPRSRVPRGWLRNLTSWASRSRWKHCMKMILARQWNKCKTQIRVMSRKTMLNKQTNTPSFIQVIETLKQNISSISSILRNATNSSQELIAGKREKLGRLEKLERRRRRIRNWW